MITVITADEVANAAEREPGGGRDGGASSDSRRAPRAGRRPGGLSLLVALFPATVLSLLSGTAAPAPATAQESALPEPLRRLERLAGSWEAERVEFLNAGGEVVRVSRATTENEMRMEGRVMVHRGRLEDPVIETLGWYYWNPDDERLHIGSVASGGRYDEFVGEWEGDRLVMVTLPSPAYEGRLYRMTVSDISETSFRERLEVSSDGGETWRVSSRQVMRRSGTPGGGGKSELDRREAREVLEAMDAYTGLWRNQDRTDAEGRSSHYEYDLRWIDPDRTIARMLLTRHSAGGRSVAFEGFKGLERDGTGVYYIATSPSGRGARGQVILEGEALVTLYDGWSADGERVQIRDVATPVADDAFVTRTYLRPDPSAEWRQIGEDHWTRTPRRSAGAFAPRIDRPAVRSFPGR